MAKLPRETTDDLRAQAAIAPADIVKAQQMVASMKGIVKYLDGDKMKVGSAERFRLMWESDTE